MEDFTLASMPSFPSRQERVSVGVSWFPSGLKRSRAPPQRRAAEVRPWPSPRARGKTREWNGRSLLWGRRELIAIGVREITVFVRRKHPYPHDVVRHRPLHHPQE